MLLPFPLPLLFPLLAKLVEEGLNRPSLSAGVEVGIGRRAVGADTNIAPRRFGSDGDDTAPEVGVGVAKEELIIRVSTASVGASARQSPERQPEAEDGGASGNTGDNADDIARVRMV